MIPVLRVATLPLLLLMATASATAQDIRGMEVCTAEKDMARRTGCLQANTEFLHQSIVKYARDLQSKLTATHRELAAAKSEISALKAHAARLDHELAELKQKAAGKK